MDGGGRSTSPEDFGRVDRCGNGPKIGSDRRVTRLRPLVFLDESTVPGTSREPGTVVV